MARAVSILISNGIKNAHALEAASAATGLPLHIAAAFVAKESRGANVYGNDTGGVFATPGAPDMPVTRTNYAEFYRRVVDLGQRSNGVGPMQITYRGYHPRAKAQGIALWEPFENMVFGFRILMSSLGGDYSKSRIEHAGTVYNVGNINGGITAYGRGAYVQSEVWRGRFAEATTSRPRQLKVGSTGAAVRDLQNGLLFRFPSYAGPIKDSGGANGVFGRGTEAVVKEFQRRTSTPITGVVDAWTRGQLTTFGIVWDPAMAQ